MSRNKEKAQSLLNLYYAQKGPQIPTQRPRSTENVKSVTDAELFRKMCIQDIDKSLMKINNPLINEYEIRDLNSKLNKLFREKRAWEHRIKDLGGPRRRADESSMPGSQSMITFFGILASWVMLNG